MLRPFSPLKYTFIFKSDWKGYDSVTFQLCGQLRHGVRVRRIASRYFPYVLESADNREQKRGMSTLI